MRALLPALSLLLPLAASAQDGFDAHGFQPAAGDADIADPLTVFRPETQVKGSWGANGLLEYANEPLVLATQQADGTVTTEPLLNHLVGLNLAGQYAPHERVAIAASVPVWFASFDADGFQGAALGDLRLAVPISAIAPSDPEVGGFGLSLVPFADLPSGAEGKFLGDGGITGGALLAAGYGTPKLDVSANLGVDAGGSMAYENLTGGSRLISGAAVAFMPRDTLGLRLEANFRPTFSKNTQPLTEAPGELLASVRGRSDTGLRWTAGAATALTPGATAAAFRLFAGAGWTFGKDIIRDADGDGFLDNVDQCVDEPETVNRWKDSDGCPDALGAARLVVRGGDGAVLPGAEVTIQQHIYTTDDNGEVLLSDLLPGLAVMASATAPKHSEASGSVQAVEGEEVPLELSLPYLPGRLKVTVNSNKGGPITSGTVRITRSDADDIELPLGDDGTITTELPPHAYGVAVVAENYGVKGQSTSIEPDADTELTFTLKIAKVKVTLDEIVILDKVFFDSGKATIKSESFELLDEVAEVIRANPQLKLIEVQGHTDSQGSDSFNQDLSQRRVDSVVTYLTDKGVAPDRLTAKGYGESVPIASNKTSSGRAQNRRVQFKILEQEKKVIEVDADEVK